VIYGQRHARHFPEASEKGIIHCHFHSVGRSLAISKGAHETRQYIRARVLRSPDSPARTPIVVAHDGGVAA